MPDDIEHLVSQASQGDQPSIESLLNRHMSGLHAYLRLQVGGIVRAKESCADLVQSVCREVLADLGDFEYRGEAAFKHWLYTAAQRKLIDKHRYYKRDKRDAGREVAGDAPAGGDDDAPGLIDMYRSLGCTPSRAAMAREELEQVEKAFDDLPEDYRDVIMMSRIIGLSHREIAEKMGRSEVATRHLLARAMARLSTLLVR